MREGSSTWKGQFFEDERMEMLLNLEVSSGECVFLESVCMFSGGVPEVFWGFTAVELKDFFF